MLLAFLLAIASGIAQYSMLQSEVKNVKELYSKLDSSVEKLDSKLDKLDSKLDKLESKLDKLESKLDNKLDKLESKLERYGYRLRQAIILSPQPEQGACIKGTC